ncbi:MAG: hypothetical protein IJB49_04750 [Clostridia bacterium]|nr:hypothetical protein [Clostridia bacterium]
MGFELLGELLPLVLSSAGVTGSVFAAIMTVVFKKVRKDAEQRRTERLKLEIMRLEGEERLSALLFAMLRRSRGVGTDAELAEAERAYNEYLNSSRMLKNEIIGEHTFE